MQTLVKQFSVQDIFGSRHIVSLLWDEEGRIIVVNDSVRTAENYQVLAVFYCLYKWRTDGFRRALSLALDNKLFEEQWKKNVEYGNVIWSYELNEEVLSLPKSSTIGCDIVYGGEVPTRRLLLEIVLTKDFKVFMIFESYNPFVTGIPEKVKLAIELQKPIIEAILNISE